MKKALFVINGMGLGNASRCDAVIRSLTDFSTVDVASSGNGFKYFRKNERVSQLFQLKCFSYGGSGGKISVIQTFSLLPAILLSFFSNVMTVSRLIFKNDYDVIFIDSDYSALFWKWFFKGPVIAINNSVWVKLVGPRQVIRSLSSTAHYIFEYLDYSFHRTIPTVTLCPSVHPPSKAVPKKFIFTLPMVRKFSNIQRLQSDGLNILVIPSASGLGIGTDLINELKKCEGAHFHVIGKKSDQCDNITFYDLITDLSELYGLCDVVVSNAGWSTISETITYGKRGVFLPIKNHCEQMANVKLVEEINGVKTVSEQTLLKELKDISKSLPFMIAKTHHFSEKLVLPEVAIREYLREL